MKVYTARPGRRCETSSDSTETEIKDNDRERPKGNTITKAGPERNTSDGAGAILYPVFLDLTGRRCVLVGGGAVANRKARRLLQARAEVVVISPESKPEIKSIATELHKREYRYGDLEGAFIAFAATDSREVNAAVVNEANERGIPVNVADEPEDGDFVLPSAFRRGRLQVAVSTGGASPTLARDIRERLEARFDPRWAGLVEEVGAARSSGAGMSERLEREVDGCLSRL